MTFNPDEHWSAPASFGYLPSPEQLEPLQSLHRTTASVSNSTGDWNTTLAAGFNREDEHTFPGYLLESTRRHEKLALFGRVEYLRLTTSTATSRLR